VKKLYRKLSRQCIYDRNNQFYQSLDLLLLRDSNKFWKSVRQSRKCRSYPSINVNKFTDHYSKIMQDQKDLSVEHSAITDSVKKKYSEIHHSVITHTILPDEVNNSIAKLKRNSSPGLDGITAEFLLYGRSNVLTQHLAALYSNLLTHNCIPSVFSTGVLVPILKKATLDPSLPSNYRPITISSVFSKLFEILIFPSNVTLCNNQYGFRADYSVSHGISLLNDLVLL
jgi:hypothetical protein